ncbi:MAG: hypothetical protein CM15mP58_22880 [Burkholderiaceae bacterium]|nr:MAG: hypothetical protein CM15mP58_22880 [Burkholderiaceae bacterium]
MSYDPNFNEKYFSEELGLNNQTLQVNSDSENRYSRKKLKKTLETVGLHLVETRKEDIDNGEQKEQKLGRKIKRNESDKQTDNSEPLTMVETKNKYLQKTEHCRHLNDQKNNCPFVIVLIEN